MKRMKIQKLRLATGFVALSLAACSSSGTSPDKAAQQNVSQSVLTFAVGTANIYGTAHGLNVYAAFRQSAGQSFPGTSAATVSEPTLSGPFGTLPAPGTPSNLDGHSTAPTGPAPGETTAFGFTAQSQTPTGVSTFGTTGGVFGLGIEPFNYNNPNGVPATNVPYAVPLFDPTTDTNSFIPWGGAPGFDPDGNGHGVHDGNVFPSGVNGVSEGLDVFYGVTPVAGSPYTLSVTVPATSTSPTTVSGTATIGSVAYLPVVTPPVPTYDGLGGVSFTATFPAGVTEEYIQVVDFGPSGASGGGCNGAGDPAAEGTPLYYTLVVKPSTAEPVKILAANGPSTAPAAICTAAQNTTAAKATTPGDSFTVQVVGFDYDAYSVSYPASLKVPNPTVPAQVDLSISAQAPFVSP
jgi:hypothetical protein